MSATFSYNGDGNLTGANYPRESDVVGTPFENYQVQYDTLGRPNKLRGNFSYPTPLWEDRVKDITYGPADELTQLTYYHVPANFMTETRSYNNRLQLTQIVASGAYGSNVNIEYRYSATQNNGQITQSKDWITGEEITHTYDALKRLTASSTTDPSWGLSFSYDGFGNRLSQSLTKGSGPTVSLSVNPANNRINSSGYVYDANGNLTTMPSGSGSLTLTYNVENQLVQVTGSGFTLNYAYGPDNRRMWKSGTGGGTGEEYYFHAPNGDRLGTYQEVGTTHLCGGIWYQPLRTNVYFAGRLVHSKNFTTSAEAAVALDRLGSVVRGDTASLNSFYPYGEPKSGNNTNPDKFATYISDSLRSCK